MSDGKQAADRTVTTTIQMPLSLLDQVRAAARAADSDVSKWIRAAIRAALKAGPGERQ